MSISGEEALTKELGISQAELQQRLDFLEFTDQDNERLTRVHEHSKVWADDIIKEFYKHLLSFEEGRAFFRDPRVLERVQQQQKAYFLKLTQGKIDSEYLENRLRTGVVHERIGVPIGLFLGMYNFYLRAMGARLLTAMDSHATAYQTFVSFTKLVFLDVCLAIEIYLQRRQKTIAQQQEAIRELSTPVLQVRDRMLILPIIGVIDSDRALQITEQLLRGVRASRALVVVIDITGVPTVDSKVANHLVQTVEAARLLGAEVIVTGLSPEIAQTLVTLGVDLSRINTVGDLQGGLEEAEKLLGYSLVRNGGAGREAREM
ncbi:MAG: STAS domain-containing protein [Deltaproteobacteria bacterium]|nr:STAS domain-containing protein [Deltaproteobacteria bacterium]